MKNKKTLSKVGNTVKRRHPHQPDLAKAAVQFYREQAYTHLVLHQSIAHTIVGLVRGGCPIQTANSIVDRLIIHSFGNTVLH